MSKKTSYKSAKAFLDGIDSAKFQADLGHTAQVVSRARANNIMPAHWYVSVRDWAADRGIDVPESFFKFDRKSPALAKQNANSNGELQEASR